MNYQDVVAAMEKISGLNSINAIISWDQETYMPEYGNEYRAYQQSLLSGMAHELFTRPELGEGIKTCLKNCAPNSIEYRNLELLLEDFERQRKFSTAFVEEMSRAVSNAFQAWSVGKQNNSFSDYAKHLQKLIDLKRKESDILGYQEHPYDAQINLHERGTTTSQLNALFEEVRKELVPFVKTITSGNQVSSDFFFQKFDKKRQWDFGMEMLRDMGYNLSAGRQDESSHPFTISLGPNDIRITTRVSEEDLAEMIWSTVHECGHALYEQGLKKSEFGLPCGEAASLGIHESQSRLWENNVGRSLPFWNYYFPKLQQIFPEQLKQITALDFFKGMNKVESSFIRTSADELTYHFHIMIRFEIEKAIFEGKLKATELPEYWNAKYKEYLGLDVPDYRQGIMQDVHWSHGSFGYFPTYSLGSFYAAQFFRQAESEIPGLEEKIAAGNFVQLLDWLRIKIHQHGRFYTAQELCKQVTGEPLNFSHFMSYAKKKYGFIYQLKK